MRIWLQRGYPKEKPLVYINPTADMAIASVGYVERDGKVGVPYLSEWKEVTIYNVAMALIGRHEVREKKTKTQYLV